MSRCPRCGRPIEPGAAILRGGVGMHVRCIVATLLAVPRPRSTVAQRIVRDLVPLEAR